MKVAGSARHALRGVFQKHQLGWNWSSDQETKALREGLRLAAGQLVQLEEAAATAQTQSYLRFPALREDGDVWVELVNELREVSLSAIAGVCMWERCACF
ncbi:hypothetical protein AK812_SmicGene46162 [Symbiodinium microadriaticum]|uniref:Uncharacterized protein n=1 Tax=Symbiodinium microadriaticum TaxID=2951 RepID=A0A1Q9BUQ4_SYMMI|nr:hypothetical protein AK812_SmicGene46162 [Symbiodinium microadriaticum]